MQRKKAIRYGSKRWRRGAYFQAVLVGSFVFVVSGGFNDLVAWESRHVWVSVSPSGEIESPDDQMTDRDREQIDCLVRNMYFEARNQSDEGMAAVSDVVFNRVEDPRRPASPCEVITEHGQFSWYEDGRDHTMRDRDQVARAYRIAMEVWRARPVHYKPEHQDQTGGATNYHATYVAPHWKSLRETVQIGLHKFYRLGRAGS